MVHFVRRLVLPPAFEQLRAKVEPILTPLPKPSRAGPHATLRALERPLSASPRARSFSSTAAVPTSTTSFRGSTRSTGAAAARLHAARAAGAAARRRALDVVPRVGYPDPETFARGVRRADGVVRRAAVCGRRVVLGGFSQGAVLSYALGRAGAPRTRALIALSGFIPTVAGWEADLESPFPPIAIAHGKSTP